MATGKFSKAISDRSGMEFPYNEMVTEWNGSVVHVSEYEEKHPQLEISAFHGDEQGLVNARPARTENQVLILLIPNAFETISASSGIINVSEKGHGRSTGDTVRFRGPTSPNGYQNVPTFDNVSDISNSDGFTITVGKIDSSGNVTNTTNYYYFQSSNTATNGNISGGGDNCSAGPVNLQG